MISIIVPVYNAARYLRVCLDSVRAQDYQDWQCICVNDGSCDESGSILDEYAAKDSRFVILPQENRGVSAARNAALDRCAGDHFTFLDADDVLLPRVLSTCAAAFGNGQMDAICCDPLFRAFVNEEELRLDAAPTSEVRPVDDRMDLLCGDSGAYGFVSGRIYSRAKFGKVRFPVGMKMCEDTWYLADALAIPARWGLWRRPLVGYRQTPASASNTIDVEFCRCVFSALCHVITVLSDVSDAGGNLIVRFWNRNCAEICHMLRLTFAQWERFTATEKAEVCGLIAKSIALTAYNPFSASYRLRIRSLPSQSSCVVLPAVGFLADWFWPRVRRRLGMAMLRTHK